MTPTEALEYHAALLVNIEHHGDDYLGKNWKDSWLIKASVQESYTSLVKDEICQTLEIAQRGYPDIGLTESDLPFPNGNGFAWLERPFNNGVPDPISALSWTTFRATQPQEGPGIAVVCWHFLRGTRFLGFADSAAVQFFSWSFGQRWSSLEQIDQMPARYLASLCTFMQQTILVSNSVLAERHARKRLVRAGFPHEPLIRVIELRRRESVLKNRHEQSDNHEDMEWSCQWIVRGHWRQQFYPTKHVNQPIWITPYVKGPEDKPLKPPRATVFNVIR
jgi:hypothetical protein